jgi:hypothetical protein
MVIWTTLWLLVGIGVGKGSSSWGYLYRGCGVWSRNSEDPKARDRVYDLGALIWSIF